MAEQHGMQPEHHAPQTEMEFFDRARERMERALRAIDETEERMAANIARERELLRRAGV